MSKIYTRSGDRGETGLVGGDRIDKAAPRIAAIGTVDELNAALGLVISSFRAQREIPAANPPKRDLSSALRTRDDELIAWLEAAQCHCFDVGAELASPDGSNRLITEVDVTALERQIDAWQATLPALTHFIVPGGSLVGAQLHLARAIARRAERTVVTLNQDAAVRPVVLAYLNRLSDALFVAARVTNREARIEETVWVGRQSAISNQRHSAVE